MAENLTTDDRLELDDLVEVTTVSDTALFFTKEIGAGINPNKLTGANLKTDILDKTNFTEDTVLNDTDIFDFQEADGTHKRITSVNLKTDILDKAVYTEDTVIDDTDILDLQEADGTHKKITGANLKTDVRDISGYVEKTTVDDTDIVSLQESDGTKKKITGANLKQISTNATGADYVKFENGMLICWGTVSITPVVDTPTSVAVTFPVTYTVSPSITVSASTTVPGSEVKEVSFANPSTTGMDIYLYRSTATTTGVRWQAIGWWK